MLVATRLVLAQQGQNNVYSAAPEHIRQALVFSRAFSAPCVIQVRTRPANGSRHRSIAQRATLEHFSRGLESRSPFCAHRVMQELIKLVRASLSQWPVLFAMLERTRQVLE